MSSLTRTGPARLDQPLYDASPRQAFVRFWKKYATFSGRASRSEFWWWYLISVVVSIILGVISVAVVGVDTTVPAPGADAQQYAVDSMLRSLKTSAASSVWSLLTFVGLLALSARRLHDTGRSGWWYLIILVPVVGIVVLIVFWASAPRPEGQRYDRA
ncbi:DUF805 domain-containing protein [Microlunatus capsulatus]|uniref:Uncharacterized membrane protein YhaH (DUF805 family) n=1 Tax=Microlunatus capsulatus TaxID=99117 RepID=A0ABS4ZD33_9ACTN|nr:DUF805 domain-containing protein [Microlunatus capsulatus]MBP2418924.1 uncharacterized membrane protein YhaH (DUF805 family) [Microlunatus capsulatus]